MSTSHRPSIRAGERGASLIEFSLVFLLLLMLGIGAFEYGMAFRDWQSVTIATREGGRVAASAANYQEADCVILEATSGALQSFDSGLVRRLHIFKSTENGGYGNGNGTIAIYRPEGGVAPQPGEQVVPDCSAWVQTQVAPNWEPADRVNPNGEPFWIGVRLEYQHPWRTGFLWWSGSANWKDDSIFRIEPPPPDFD
jgi:hypothetical protein